MRFLKIKTCNRIKIQEEIKISFKNELQDLINKHSKENGSDTPDFILAEYLNDCLINFNKAVLKRSEWYNPESTTEKIDIQPLKKEQNNKHKIKFPTPWD